MINVGMISLGCAKNLVDSEIMLGHLRQAGMRLTPDADEADVVIVNTCSFIHDAKKESIAAILQMNRERGLNKKRKNQKLIVAGCMSQRFSRELSHEMPEVDAFVGLDQLTEIDKIVRQVVRGKKTGENYVTAHPNYIPDYDTSRFRLTPKHYAYIKIAEGCNHPCSFCVIPRIRGRYRSRTVKSIVKEAKQLVDEGVKELLLISQDSTYFGMDAWDMKAGSRQPVERGHGECLIDLLEELNGIRGDFWIRLLYTHPAHWSDDLILAMRDCEKVVKYVDVPLQHIHSEILGKMRRQTSSEHIRDVIERIRAGIPDVAIRTAFIVGFPSETERHFETLMEFIEEAKFERMGVFEYSREEGSRAAQLPRQVSAAAKKQRYKKAMKLQQRLSKVWGEAMIGKKIRVLTEGGTRARSEFDAPEVDGQVILSKPRAAGKFVEVRIGGSDIYDLFEATDK